MTYYNREYENNPYNFTELSYVELITETFGAGGGAYYVRFNDKRQQWIPKKCACLYKVSKKIEVKHNFCQKENLLKYQTKEV